MPRRTENGTQSGERFTDSTVSGVDDIVPKDQLRRVSQRISDREKAIELGNERLRVTESTESHFSRLPTETLQLIVGHAICSPPDCTYHQREARYHEVVLVNREWAEVASNVYWETREYHNPQAEPALRHLAKLPLQRQQYYANKIKRLRLLESEPLDFITALKLEFPRLVGLEVRHSVAESGYLCLVAQFIQERLLDLELVRTYRTDNFLALLPVARNLRTLVLSCTVIGATSQDLLTVIHSCRQLQTINFEWSSKDLVNEDVFVSIASLPHLTTLRLQNFEVTSAMARRIPVTASPRFPRLSDLRICYFQLEAISVLNDLPSLTFLELGITTSSSGFEVFGTIPNLQSLHVRYHEPVQIGYRELSCLNQLEALQEFTIMGKETWSTPDFVNLSSVQYGEFVQFFKVLPQLEKIVLRASLSNTPALYIAAGEICRNLRSLDFDGQFDCASLRRQHLGESPLYPVLQHLSVYQFIEATDEHTRDERVHDTVCLLNKCAPQTWHLGVGRPVRSLEPEEIMDPVDVDVFTSRVEWYWGDKRRKDRIKYLDEKYGKDRRSGMPIGTYV